MMKCFLPACFGSSKRSKRSKELLENLDAKGSREEREEETVGRVDKKDEQHGEGEGEFSESLFSLSIGSTKQISAAQKADTAEVNSPMQQLLGVGEEDSEELGSGTPIAWENVQGNPSKPSEADIPKPAEKQNCIAIEKVNPDEEGDVNVNGEQKESSESLFSLSVDSRKPISLAEIVETEVTSLRQEQDREEETQERIHEVSSVLNPIENFATQGRVAKSTLLKSQKNDDKENINNSAVENSPEPSMKLSKRKARKRVNDNKQEIGVDTSLSSWLVEPEGTPVPMSNSSAGEQTPKGGSRGSPWSNEDRPILGALTVEEIRMYSLSRSSRRTRSKSPDEKPIIGTVGSYWTHTGQDMDSNFEEHRWKKGCKSEIKFFNIENKTRKSVRRKCL